MSLYLDEFSGLAMLPKHPNSSHFVFSEEQVFKQFYHFMPYQSMGCIRYNKKLDQFNSQHYLALFIEDFYLKCFVLKNDL